MTKWIFAHVCSHLSFRWIAHGLLVGGLVLASASCYSDDKPSTTALPAEPSAVVQQSEALARDLTNGAIDTRMSAKKIQCETVSDIQKKATAGVAMAQYQMGLLLETGTCLKSNLEVAVYWYTKSMVQDFPDALIAIGHLYRVGRGVGVDRLRAYGLYERAGLKGSAKAHGFVGICWLDGIFVPRDEKEAFKSFLRGVEGKDAASFYWAGSMLMRGQGTPRDTGTGYVFLKEASKLEYEPAVMLVAHLEREYPELKKMKPAGK